MGQVNEINLERVFTYQPATKDQQVAYENVRNSAIILAEIILKNVPNCADRSDALRKLRECRMVANAAIALNGEI